MQENLILMEKHGRVRLLQINRPQAMNALSPELMLQLAKLLEEFDGVYYTDDATWQVRLPEQQSGGTHLYGAYSVYNLNSYSFDDLKWDRDLILDEYTKSENSQLVERVTEKLLIKGKVSKICEFFDAEYDVNTVLRLDPHYRT